MENKDLILIRKASYAKYEEVLLRRDNLRKEAEQYNLDFIREFGDLITEAFSMKIECIRKKKMISYCQRIANQGKVIMADNLFEFIEREMREYQEELDAMLRDVSAVKNSSAISPMDLRKIKEIYYRLVKLIHPDIHPELAESKVISDYWQRIVIAYRYNRLKDLEELELLVKQYLETKGYDPNNMEIEDIDAKILKVQEEIEEIITTNPYLYKLLLADPAEVKEKKREYEDEISAYQKYSEELDGILATFNIEENYS